MTSTTKTTNTREKMTMQTQAKWTKGVFSVEKNIFNYYLFISEIIIFINFTVF